MSGTAQTNCRSSETWPEEAAACKRERKPPFWRDRAAISVLIATGGREGNVVRDCRTDNVARQEEMKKLSGQQRGQWWATDSEKKKRGAARGGAEWAK